MSSDPDDSAAMKHDIFHEESQYCWELKTGKSPCALEKHVVTDRNLIYSCLGVLKTRMFCWRLRGGSMQGLGFSDLAGAIEL